MEQKPLDDAPREEPELPPVSRRKTYLAYAAATALLLVFGVLRLPYETALTQQQAAANLRDVKLNLSLRSKIGQLSFLAVLSGFRGLVADYLWIQANTAWEKVEYGRMNFLFNTVTTLTPHNINFWDMSGWHMAYNASVAALNDPKEKRRLVKAKREREYVMLGKDFLERGIVNNPQSYLLHQNLGNIYKYKLGDHCNAALEYDRAAALPGAPSYEKRFAAYELAECPGHEREAWQKLRKLYDMGEQERLPTLEISLKAMEEKLDLPDDQRVFKKQFVNPVDTLREKLHLPGEQRVYKTP